MAGVVHGDVLATIMPDDCWHAAVFHGLPLCCATSSGFNHTLANSKSAMDIERSRFRAPVAGDADVDVAPGLLAKTCVERIIVYGERVPIDLADLRAPFTRQDASG
jgi:hypothetical protein